MLRIIPEKDWKYLRSIQSELLSSLCKKINDEATEILASREMTEHDKYRALYRHMLASDEIIAQCFDDWRRSTIHQKVIMLFHNGLLLDEHVSHLSDDVKNLLKGVHLKRGLIR